MDFKDNELLRKKAGELLTPMNHRVCNCGKPMSKKVCLNRHVQTGKYSFSSIETCGNVWVCKVCATKVTERRRQEILKAYTKHLGEGYICGLLTLTFPHTQQDDLLRLSMLEAKATKLFKQRQGWKKFAKHIKGSIRGFEITHGINGWHLHSHHLIFFNRKTLKNAKELDSWDNGLYSAWRGACLKAGLPEPSQRHGVDLTLNAIGSYVSKWGLDLEMSKSHLKLGKKSSKTPFQLLISEDEIDNFLFTEFAHVFVKKRKQQLRWSNGLKKQFNIEVKTDEALADEEANILMDDEVTIPSYVYYYFWINGLSYLLKNALEKGGEIELIELIERRKSIVGLKKQRLREQQQIKTNNQIYSIDEVRICSYKL